MYSNMEKHDNNGWAEYKLLILNKLDVLLEDQKENRKQIDILGEKVDSLKKDVISLKIKAGVFSAVIATVVGIVVNFFTNSKH